MIQAALTALPDQSALIKLAPAQPSLLLRSHHLTLYHPLPCPVLPPLAVLLAAESLLAPHLRSVFPVSHPALNPRQPPQTLNPGP